MKHQVQQRSFGRVKKQREALLRSLARSLVLHERIQTTEAKAKELRPFIEKLVTKARPGTHAAHRGVYSRLQSKRGTRKLIEELAPRYKDRKGGYTRITKMPNRQVDAARMAIIEFV